MHRRFLIALTAVSALALPATASAATTWIVDPLQPNTGACDGTTKVCKTIGQARTAAVNGDTIVIKPGSYSETGLDFSQTNITIQAEQPGTVVIGSPGPAGDDVIAFGPPGTGSAVTAGPAKLAGVVINVSADGGSGVFVNAKNVTLDTVVVTKSTASTNAAADVPSIDIDPEVTADTTTIDKSFVLHTAGKNASAIFQRGAGNQLILRDTVVASGPNHGAAVHLTGSKSIAAPTQIVRSTLLAQKTSSHALEYVNDPCDDTTKQIKVDSTFLIAGQNSAGLFAQHSAGDPIACEDPNSFGGDTSIPMTHVTIAGSTKGVIIQNDADPAPSGPPAGKREDLLVSANRSIIKGASTVTVANPPSCPDSPVCATGTAGGTANLDIVNSDTPQAPASGITANGNTNTPDDQLFVDPAGKNFHLLGSAPVIDQGETAIPEGDSTKDVDGQDRIINGKADKGADEFTNTPPVAALTASTGTPNQGVPVTFDASGSSDPEPGGSIKQYIWSFGDGTTETTTTPTVQHAYANLGPYPVTVTVVDAVGAQSPPAAITIEVRDGLKPTVGIKTPRAGQTLQLFSVKTTTKRVKLKKRKGQKKQRFKKVKVVKRTRRSVLFTGTAADAQGLAKVEIAIRRVSVAKTKAKASADCVYLEKDTLAFRVRNCSTKLFFPVRVVNGAWSYTLPQSFKAQAGVYEVTARSTDTNNNVSDELTNRFTLK